MNFQIWHHGNNAVQHDKDLRGDVDPKEVEIDPKTGMKNYIANEELTIDEHGTKIDTSGIVIPRCPHQYFSDVLNNSGLCAENSY
jgi:hypothetical protein